MSDKAKEDYACTKPAAAVAPNTSWLPYSMSESTDKETLEKPIPFLNDVQIRMENLHEILKEEEYVPRNILLVGRPHAGKSAFINLIHACMRGRFEGIAESGSANSGDSGAHTYHLRFFPNLGLTDRQLREFREHHDLSKDFRLPTIIDMPGIETQAEVMKYVLSGAVPPDTELQTYMTDKALTPFLDFKNAKSRKVDRVVFVASIKDDPQEKLLKDVLKFVRGNEGTLPSIPYYLAVTHVDQVESPRSEEESNVMSTLLDCLMLRGEAKLRVHEVVNYCDKDELDPKRDGAYATNLEKHVRGLSFLCKVLQRRDVIMPPNIPDVPIDEFTPMIDWVKRTLTAFWQFLWRCIEYAGGKLIQCLRYSGLVASSTDDQEINWNSVIGTAFFFVLFVIAVILGIVLRSLNVKQ